MEKEPRLGVRKILNSLEEIRDYRSRRGLLEE